MRSCVYASAVTMADISTVRCISGEEAIRSYHPRFLSDESKMEGTADLVFLPKDEREVAAVIDHLSSLGRTIRVSGNRTGLVGGAVPDGDAVLSFENMSNLLGVGEEGGRFFVRVQSGISLEEMDSTLLRGDLQKVSSITPGAVERMISTGKRYHYPIDPTERSGSIGGNVAANASGARTFKYGPTRDWVRRLRVMLASGEVLDLVRGEHPMEEGKVSISATRGRIDLQAPSYRHFERAVKNAAGIFSAPGMDLIDLFIGSEGILGVITEVDLFLVERTQQIANIIFFPSNEDAFRFVRLLRDSNVSPEFIEYIDGNGLDLLRGIQERDPGRIDMPPIPGAGACIFFDLPYDASLEGQFRVIDALAHECGSSLDRSWSAHEDREMARFKRFRHAVPQAVYDYISERKRDHPHIHKLGTDMSVPDEHLEGMMAFYIRRLEESAIGYVIFGHIGNNHPHVELLLHDMEEFERGKALYEEFALKAVSLGGSSSAEHGIGRIKRRLLRLMYSDEEISQMVRVKTALDPGGTLNPGNMLEGP